MFQNHFPSIPRVNKPCFVIVRLAMFTEQKSECASASTAAPSFIAWGLLRLPSRRWMEYAACDFAFGKVLCINFLLVLCKFFASFLRSFLRSLRRSSARAAESAGIVRLKKQQHRSKMKTIWPRASARGTENQQKYEKVEKNANANTKMRKIKIFFMCCDFLKKRIAQRLGCFFEKSDKKYCLKQSTKKRNENRQLANVHWKNDLSKATKSQRHKDY